MSQDKKTFKDDIEAAEKNLLIASWAGVGFSIAIIVHALMTF
tara:strand:- start:482 stop:607 length:126 start_codon:yes stop_codon:yes gene_type:complete